MNIENVLIISKAFFFRSSTWRKRFCRREVQNISVANSSYITKITLIATKPLYFSTKNSMPHQILDLTYDTYISFVFTNVTLKHKYIYICIHMVQLLSWLMNIDAIDSIMTSLLYLSSADFKHAWALRDFQKFLFLVRFF